MKELIIFAGGLGSRLNGTEKMPKPLVPINGSTMLSIIVKEYEKTGIFSKYIILISDRKDLYDDWKDREMAGVNINIINEGKRTGRTGAINHFLKTIESEDKGKVYALANGDTVIENIHKVDLLKCFEYNEEANIPAVLVMKADNKREDAKNIKIGNTYFSNSGFVVVNKAWMESICANDERQDIDSHIFNEDNFKPIITESRMVDVGTPQRLLDYRRSRG